MFFYSDDPHKDFDRWDAECERRRALLPVCSECGEPVTSEFYYLFDGGLLICEDCLNENHCYSTADYEEDC